MSESPIYPNEHVAEKYKCDTYSDHAWTYVHDPDSKPTDFKKCQLCGAIDAMIPKSTKSNGEDVFYICKADGFHPNNTYAWCALGCGSDYNQMISFPKEQIRDYIYMLFEDKPHPDAFYTRGEIRRKIKEL